MDMKAFLKLNLKKLMFNTETSHLEIKKNIFFFTCSKLHIYYMGMSITKHSTHSAFFLIKCGHKTNRKPDNISKQVLEPRKATRKLSRYDFFVKIYTNIHKNQNTLYARN